MNKINNKYWDTLLLFLREYWHNYRPSLLSIGKKITSTAQSSTVVFALLLSYLCLFFLCFVFAKYNVDTIISDFYYSSKFLIIILFLAIAFGLYLIISKWEKCKSVFQDNIEVCSLFLLYVLFYDFWEGLIGKRIIDGFLCYFNSNLFNDVLFVLAVAGCFVVCYLNRGKSIKQSTKLVCIIAILYWVYYRWICKQCGDKENPYNLYFESLSLIEFVKYVDIVPLYALCKLVPSYFVKSTFKKFDGDIGYIRDVPIVKEKEDMMGRKKFAQIATSKLIKTDTSNGSFTFGIDAPWGAGKSSFMNMMKEEIYCMHNDSIVLDFNPWLYAEEKDLVSVFFDELSKSLRRYDLSLAKDIIDYSQLLSAFDTKETKLISSLMRITHNNSSLQEKKELIRTAIKRIQKQIFVFIDDLDRLDADELMEMMKLIRNISDFPYLYFVAAYDKLYLIECLGKRMKTKEVDFTEKIFQIELKLLEGPKTDLGSELIRRIDNYIEKDDKQDFNSLIEDSVFVNALSNNREIKRIANSFLIYYECLKGFINVRDLLLLEILKTKYPLVYSHFVKHRKIYLRKNGNKIELLSQKIKGVSFQTIVLHLEKQYQDLKLRQADIKIIDNIFLSLFPNDKEIVRGISDANYHENYFTPISSDIDIPEIDFLELLRTENIDLIEKMFHRWSIYKKISLGRILNEYLPLKCGEVKILIEVLLFTIHNNYADNVSNDLITKYITLFGNRTPIEKFAVRDKEYIEQLLTKYGYSSNLCFYLYSLIYEKDKWNYPLSKDVVNQIRIEIFYNCLNQCPKSFKDIIPCFLLTAEVVRVNGIISKAFLSEIVNTMKSHVVKNISFFLPAIIIPIGEFPTKNGQGSFILNHNIINALWGTIDEFYIYIGSLKSTQVLKEFKEFIQSYINANCKSVSFSFKKIHDFVYNISYEVYDELINVSEIKDDLLRNELNYYYSVLPIQESVLNACHPNIISSYKNIGEIYKQLKFYDKALQYFEKVLYGQKQILEKSHPELANTYNTIGFIYYNKEDYLRALDYYEKAIKIEQNKADSDQVNMGLFLNNIGMVYYKLERYFDAGMLLEAALKKNDKLFGPKDALTIHIQKNLDKANKAYENDKVRQDEIMIREFEIM